MDAIQLRSPQKSRVQKPYCSTVITSADQEEELLESKNQNTREDRGVWYLEGSVLKNIHF